jgi:hypothetical protein
MCGTSSLTLGESASDKTGSQDVETPEAQIPKVNIDHPIRRGEWHLIFNFEASKWR